MTRYERHPAPEKLLLQITTEAVNLLALGTQDKPADVSLLETGAALTVKAWGLPQELLESSTALIQHQKELLATASGKAALPDERSCAAGGLSDWTAPLLPQIIGRCVP